MIFSFLSKKKKKKFVLKLFFFFLQGQPSRPRVKLISTDSTSAKLELKVRSDLPLLWCSIFHRAKFGQPKETLLPGRNLNNIHITNLKCGTTYRSVLCTFICMWHIWEKSWGGGSLQNVQFTFVYDNLVKRWLSLKMYLVAH